MRDFEQFTLLSSYSVFTTYCSVNSSATNGVLSVSQSSCPPILAYRACVMNKSILITTRLLLYYLKSASRLELTDVPQPGILLCEKLFKSRVKEKEVDEEEEEEGKEG